ncbi:MAG: glycoside hydrolase family 38 C-terminal domain-containing protein [Mycetocola sp.]
MSDAAPQSNELPRTEAPDATPRPAATPHRTLHMIGNAHLDPVWLWPWQEGYQEARATFWSAIERMDEYPDFVFTCDQVALLSWVEESDPALFERIRDRVAEGRWVNTGGWWVEPDCNMPMGESFVRQGLYGQRFLRSRFGRIATVGMNVDPFGHNVMLPQILRGQGMDSYVFLRPGPHESTFDATLFWWESPDGSRVLAYRIPYEYGSPPEAIDGQTDKALGALDRSIGDAMIFYGVGNHGGGPTKANIESIHRYDRMGSFGRMIMSSPRTYFDEVLADTERLERLPVRRDDLQHHAPGCYSAHSGIKAWQKRAQYALLSAERWAAIVAVRDNVDYPRAQLERAWKQVLFNQFHDVLPGSAIDSAYTDARDQLGEAVAVSKRILVRSHNILARQVAIDFEPESQPVLVFNQHSWPVTTDVNLNYGSQKLGVHVVDDDGEPVLFQHTQPSATTGDSSRGAVLFRAEVPALGYRLYRLRPGELPVVPTSGSLTVSDRVLENDLVRIEIDAASGWISSYLDKATGVDVMRDVDGATHTQICQDPTDTWGHRVLSYAWPGAPMATTRIVVRETGPLRSRLRIERAWGASSLVEEFLLGRDSRSLRIDVSLDWRERAHLLKLRFPTRLEAPEATYDVPFGTLRRPVDGSEEPAQSWVDLTGTVDGRPAGVTVITTNKHGFDASGGSQPSIGVTAVRSPVYSWHDPRLLQNDGIYSYQDQGLQRFSVELVPHSGDWRKADPDRRASVLGSPVRAMLESSHGGILPARHSFVSDAGGQVRVTAVKGSEDAVDSAGSGTADLIVRAVETRGEPAITRIDLPVVGRVLEEAFGPSQVRTFRVPRDPALPVVEVDLIEEPLSIGWPAPAASPESGATEPIEPLPEPGAEDRRSSKALRPMIE